MVWGKRWSTVIASQAGNPSLGPAQALSGSATQCLQHVRRFYSLRQAPNQLVEQGLTVLLLMNAAHCSYCACISLLTPRQSQEPQESLLYWSPWASVCHSNDWFSRCITCKAATLIIQINATGWIRAPITNSCELKLIRSYTYGRGWGVNWMVFGDRIWSIHNLLPIFLCLMASSLSAGCKSDNTEMLGIIAHSRRWYLLALPALSQGLLP